MTEPITQPGGTGTGEPTTTQPGGTGTGGSTTTGAPGAPAQQTTTQPGGTGTGGTDPAAEMTLLRSQLAAARDEAAKARTVGKQTAATEAEAALLSKMAKALGLAKDEAPDPEKLAADLAQATTEHRSALVELQVLKVAGAEKADPVALLDSRSFLASVKDLDPKSDGFTDAIKAAVAKAVKDNPKLGAGTPVGSSGGEIQGGTGERPPAGGSMEDVFKQVRANRGRH